MPGKFKAFPRQLDIWWVDLEPTVGVETQKLRPCVVLQNNVLNSQRGTFIVAPLLPYKKEHLFAVKVTKSSINNLDSEYRSLNLMQMRAVDFSRFKTKNGELEESYLSFIDRALAFVFRPTNLPN